MQAKIIAVGKMQAYIAEHLNEEVTLADLGKAAGYSKYHAARIFKELTGHTPFAAIRALRLTRAAEALQGARDRVVEVALDSGFASHDGFTRAFARRFAITPKEYQRETPAVAWFVPYPVEACYRLKEGKSMEKKPAPLVVTWTCKKGSPFAAI